jgi:membrane protein DedA with SNARE-associated domain
MSIQTISNLILEYRYWILIPLALIEGPIVAFIAGTLAAVGYFDLYVLLGLFFVRDVGLDGVYYMIGHYGGKTAFIKRMLSKIGVTGDDLEQVRTLWEKHPAKTMFIGKLSYGIAQIFIVAAGTVKMRLSIFFKYGSIVAIAQFWTLILLGYFFGVSFGGKISNVLQNLQYILLGLGIVIAGYYIISWRMRKNFLKGVE